VDRWQMPQNKLLCAWSKKLNQIRITNIKFSNFKALSDYSVSLQDTNILVGANNAGKSTIVSAFRILDVALKKARARNAVRINLPGNRSCFGHQIPEEQITVTLENVATNYNDEHSKIEFKLSNNVILTLFFPNDGGCFFYSSKDGSSINTTSKFKNDVPIKIQVIPVLGPLEHDEQYVTPDTVKNSLNTHRACRHFRNYWYHNNENWDLFENMIRTTWPGMEIFSPELNVEERKLTMFVSENRIARELYWAGFGFQIWCQLLTHLSRANGSNLVVIDEPEIYLHPDIQRQLLNILRNIDSHILLATHSVEIIGEADPSEILLVNKTRKSAYRLRDIDGVQQAIESLGSAQNITLTHLARTKKIVFFEGANDYKIVRRFAKILGFDILALGNDITALESGGYSSWSKIKSFCWGLKSTISTNLQVFAVYDRDYYCDEEIAEVQNELGPEITMLHIHERKEIENYLLNIVPLQRAFDAQLLSKSKRTGNTEVSSKTITDYLFEITDTDKNEIMAQYIAKNTTYHRGSTKDTSILSLEAIQKFEQLWSDINTRLSIIPGKSTLRKLRDLIQRDHSINLTDFQIIDSHHKSDIPNDLVELITKLEEFRLRT